MQTIRESGSHPRLGNLIVVPGLGWTQCEGVVKPFHAVRVTAEVAGSSPVVPAISNSVTANFISSSGVPPLVDRSPRSLL